MLRPLKSCKGKANRRKKSFQSSISKTFQRRLVGDMGGCSDGLCCLIKLFLLVFYGVPFVVWVWMGLVNLCFPSLSWCFPVACEAS